MSHCPHQHLHGIRIESTDWCEGVPLPPLNVVLRCRDCGDEVVRPVSKEQKGVFVSSDYVRLVPLGAVLETLETFINEQQAAYEAALPPGADLVQHALAIEKLALLNLLNRTVASQIEPLAFYLPKETVQNEREPEDPYVYRGGGDGKEE